MSFIANLIEKMAKTLGADVKATDIGPEFVVAYHDGRRLDVTDENVFRLEGDSRVRYWWSIAEFPGHVNWLVTGEWE